MQRDAVRALGHLARCKSTFESVLQQEQEVAKFALKKRLEYHRNLLTRGVGDLEMENCKEEEWATQL